MASATREFVDTGLVSTLLSWKGTVRAATADVTARADSCCISEHAGCYSKPSKILWVYAKHSKNLGGL